MAWGWVRNPLSCTAGAVEPELSPSLPSEPGVLPTYTLSCTEMSLLKSVRLFPKGTRAPLAEALNDRPRGFREREGRKQVGLGIS